MGSYGKALQKTAIVTWLGRSKNKEAAQKALKARAFANRDAVFGKYKAGTCASVGTDGNINQAAGPYKEPAQRVLRARAGANSDAVFGKYTAGTCASVGT